ncbi:hypothetical protein ILP86_12865 [Microbacterium sp. R1]|nr:hypothetical protein [Microbacterium sp. R1]
MRVVIDSRSTLVIDFDGAIVDSEPIRRRETERSHREGAPRQQTYARIQALIMQTPPRPEALSLIARFPTKDIVIATNNLSANVREYLDAWLPSLSAASIFSRLDLGLAKETEDFWRRLGAILNRPSDTLRVYDDSADVCAIVAKVGMQVHRVETGVAG